MITAKHLYKTYGKTTVLKDLSLTIEQGKITSIVGTSGAGKTTLLQILGTLDTFDPNPDSELIIGDQNVQKLSDKQRSKFRNENMGFIFQSYELLPEFTALENICIPAWIGGKSKAQSKDKALGLLEYLGIANRSQHKPSELSGGEQQRVAIARALINDPDIIFADEPSGNLDTNNARELYQLFSKLKEEKGQTLVIVTHSEKLAQMSDTNITMKDGRIESIETN